MKKNDENENTMHWNIWSIEQQSEEMINNFNNRKESIKINDLQFYIKEKKEKEKKQIKLSPPSPPAKKGRK